METINKPLASVAIGMICCIFECAENYFQDGAKWMMEFDYIGPGGIPIHKESVYELKDPIMIGDKMALNLVSTTDNAQVIKAILRSDDDKVYFLANKETEEWQLLYDFGLNVNEECVVELGHGPIPDNNPIYRASILCEKICRTQCNPDIELMYLSEKIMEPIHTDVDSHGYWLKGIGSLKDPLYNCAFNLDGYSGTVNEFIYKDKILYKRNKTGIMGNPDDKISIFKSEKTLTADSNDEGISIYDMKGTKIAEGQDSLQTDPAIRGIYLVKTRKGFATIRY